MSVADTKRRKWEKEDVVFLLPEIIVGAASAVLKPGERIAQIVSMCPGNRKKSARKESHQDPKTRLSGCQMLLLMLGVGLFEPWLTSDVHRDR